MECYKIAGVYWGNGWIVKISFANKIAVACAVLHNFCLLNQDEWNDDENDDPQDQGHENKNDDVIRDAGDDVRSVSREYLANA